MRCGVADASFVFFALFEPSAEGGGLNAACTFTEAVALELICGPGPVVATTSSVLVKLPVTSARVQV